MTDLLLNFRLDTLVMTHSVTLPRVLVILLLAQLSEGPCRGKQGELVLCSPVAFLASVSAAGTTQDPLTQRSTYSVIMEVAAQPSPRNTGLMLPPPSQPARGPSVTVLDEDQWTEKIEGIIRRDFFPDLPKLENKLEWLQAVRTGDPENMRQAQMNIAQRRAGMKTPLGATPAHLATPGASMLWAPIRQGTPAMTPGAATPGQTPGAYPSDSQQAGASLATDQSTPSLSLDKFFKHHNSEDNASFSVIREGEAKRRRAQKPWLFTDKNQKQLEAPRSDVTDAHLLPAPFDDRPNLLISWPHTNKSALYYDSSQQAPLALTKDELAEQVQGPPRQISHSNTRMKASDAADPQAAHISTEPGTSSHLPGMQSCYPTSCVT